MPKPPRMSGEDVRKALLKGGFQETSQKGSHVKLKHTDGRIVIVPLHRELKTGTLKSILRQARLTAAELLALSKR